MDSTPQGLLVHIFADAPEVGFSELSAIDAAIDTYEQTDSLADAPSDAVETGLATYTGLWFIKSCNVDNQCNHQ